MVLFDAYFCYSANAFPLKSEVFYRCFWKHE